MSDVSPAEKMAAAAADAIELSEVYFPWRLDYTELSITYIDRSVDMIDDRMPEGRTKENIGLLCVLWGAYLGEVFRRNVGGEWVYWENEQGRAIAFRSGGVTIFPQDKVLKRILQGPEHDLVAYYQALRDQMTAGRSDHTAH